jgi:hypothetical protein
MSLGKRQLNQLIGFLDKSGAVKDSLGGRENPALRAVRAKREAEEAGAKPLFHVFLPIIMSLTYSDREYRKGVHWLETLRLRRTKILESGYKAQILFLRLPAFLTFYSES